MAMLRGVLVFAATASIAAYAAAGGKPAGGPAGKWTFEKAEGLKLENAALAGDPERGRCLRLFSSSSKATAGVPSGIPDIMSVKTPFTVMLWLKPDKDMLSDFEVAMAGQMSTRASKFASAMHDGKWHHIAVSFNPARKDREYAVYLDWHDEKSPWRFFSFRPVSRGISQCVLPVAFAEKEVVFGGKAGLSSYSVGYKGLIDDVAIYPECLSGGGIVNAATVTSSPPDGRR